MGSIFNRLDDIEDTVMSELKDFQRATVERIDYLYRKGQRRILVSDEVGLGKTLVARGTIAKFAKLRKEEGDDLVKVVYICSNATIADQNLDKLRIVNEIRAEDTHTSRLSMQHLNIFKQENDTKVLNNYIQLIPLTPQTSFKVSNSQGTINERALIYTILKRVPRLKTYSEQLEEIFRFGTSSWADSRDSFENQFLEVNAKSKGKYEKYMVNAVSDYLKNNSPKQEKILLNPYFDNETVLKDLIKLCKRVRRYGFDKSEAKPFIVELRLIFSDISLNKLEPDIIIMDEFQRFRYLLNSDKESEMGKLTTKFFNSDDVRILMLSATPYKMYSTLDEIDEEQIDAHFSEFFEVMNFLNICPKEKIKFKDVWNDYSIKLKEFANDKDSFIVAKAKAENSMYKNICRTERITENQLSDIIDNNDVKEPLEVLEEDIVSFIEVQKLLDDLGLGINVPIDYVKSSPYLMSFMKNYKLKRRIESYFKRNSQEIYKMNKDTFWLNEIDIANYNVISYNNARLIDLMKHVLKDNADKLLWIPPSKPYYPLEGAFKGTHNFSKTLIFSSWEMVPRMISSLVSYEVERKTIGKLNRDINYFSQRRYPYPRLNFALREGKPAQMALLTLIYPSKFLIDSYDPIDCLNRNLSLDEIEQEIKEKIRKELYNIPFEDSLPEDPAWYYLSPLLLDKLYLDGSDSNNFVDMWFKDVNELFREDKQKGFLKHLKRLEEKFNGFYNDELSLGRMPEDLVDVLCDMSIASPAICIYRSYNRELANRKLTLADLIEKGLIGHIVAGKASSVDDFLDIKSINKIIRGTKVSKYDLIESGLIDKNLANNALFYESLFEIESIDQYVKYTTQVARRFLNTMNSPESIAVIDLIFESDVDDAYWRNVLKYSKQGNLQAVFDEYVHLLSNGLDVNNENRIPIINSKLLSSMDLRTASYDIDTFNSFNSRMSGKSKDVNYLRTHFAVAFTKGRTDDSDTNRKKSVRDAFNAPFRPFVLASTSIGQEGLDFHNYCRRIVHWNLPSNPIDLEQREGRINRFECLAIRQNLAKRYGDMKFNTNNIWLELFDKASEIEKVDDCSDLIPYWGLKESEDMIRIERIVPMYPFSRDEIRYDRLIKILSLYRLTLGQARQEELIESIFNSHLENEDLMKNINDLFINLSPYYKGDVEDFEIDCEELEEDEDFENKEILDKLDEKKEDILEDLSDVDVSEDDLIEEEDNIFDVILEDLENDTSENFSKDDLGVDEDMDIRMKYCFNCGAELVIKGSKFCYNCGQDLRVENLDLNGNESIDSLDDINKEFISQVKPEILENNRCNGKELQKISRGAPELGDLRDYWVHIRQIIVDNKLFNENFIKWDNRIYWIPINNLPLNLARIEFLVHKGFIETKLYISWDKNLYLFLKKKKDHIERELGFECEFFERSNVKASKIAIYNKINLNDNDCWNDAKNWHIYMGKRFYDVFSSLIESYYPRNPVKYKNLREKYWKKLDNSLDKKDLITMDVHHEWANYPFIIKNFGWNEVRLVLTAYTNHKKIQIDLACNGEIFDYLFLQKKDIEDELGFSLNWKGGKWHSDIFVIHRADIRDKNNWEESIIWHLDMVNKFKKVFIPRINEFYNR